MPCMSIILIVYNVYRQDRCCYLAVFPSLTSAPGFSALGAHAQQWYFCDALFPICRVCTTQFWVSEHLQTSARQGQNFSAAATCILQIDRFQSTIMLMNHTRKLMNHIAMYGIVSHFNPNDAQMYLSIRSEDWRLKLIEFTLAFVIWKW